MDPYKDPTWIPIWILYRSLCGSYIGRLYVNVFTPDPKCKYFIRNMHTCVHNVNISPEIQQFRTGRKSSQNVKISLEICVKVLHLIQNCKISYEICTTVDGSCLDPSKMSIFHLKNV